MQVPTQTDRIVKPRKPNSNAARPIVVVIDDQYMTEEGELGDTASLVRDLRRMPLSTVVSAGESVLLLKQVQSLWGELPNFNFRVTPIEREIFTPNNPRKQVMSVTAVAWFGWKEKPGRNNSIRNRYHLLIDPLSFSGSWLSERTFAAHLEWAQQLREFCVTQRWDLKPTQGAVARQALRDSRFYPEARRKVPRATNDKVRGQLPGNHYQLYKPANPEREYAASYLDQTKCHHFHAKEALLPDANSLYGYGRFRQGGKSVRRNPARVKSFLSGFSGMVKGVLYWPVDRRNRERFVPKYLQNYGTESQPANQPVYFFTEDLPLLDSLGVRVTGIVSAWGSYEPDRGISAYAAWALEELGDKPPLWKKRLLLAPYGALATTARKHKVAYHQSRSGARTVLRSKSGTELTVSLHETVKESEPTTNNVLHRALIEASNRTETLMFANYLQDQGATVLAIYVDAVIVEDDPDLEYLLLPPWRLDMNLTRLRFLSESQFVSDQVEKLPGITGAQRKQYVNRGSYGGHSGATLGDWGTQRVRRWQAWQDGKDLRNL